MRSVHLVCMPYQNISLAPLAPALLATHLRRHGVRVEESYFNLRFAELIGWDRYFAIAEGGTKQAFTGELLFAEDYWGKLLHPEALERLEQTFGPRAERSALLEAFAAHCLSAWEAAPTDWVGFTTSSSQLMPSLWLARLLKQRAPHTRTVFGGAACALPMGARLKQSYREVDQVVSGYGEDLLLSLALRGSRSLVGVLQETRRVALDALPIPEYDRFLDQFRRFDTASIPLRLAFESSRGCWWGEKNHCTFCGLNQLEMAFNAKSEARVVEEVRALWHRYGMDLFATDTILAREHLKRVIPQLACFERKPSIFYEVKANMSQAEVQSLAQARIDWIQPGIESLSTPVLQLLNKGVSAIQNVALLKWCREQGIRVSWNLLCAVPGEKVGDYDLMLGLLEHLPQLAPPQGVSPIRIDRYSPYFNRFDEFGWTGLRPAREYAWLHPQLQGPELHDIAYYFDGIGADSPILDYLARLQQSVRRWQERHRGGQGLFVTPEGALFRIDESGARWLHGDSRLTRVLARSHELTTVPQLVAGSGCSPGNLAELEHQGILFREGTKVINLAVRLPGAAALRAGA